MKVLLIKDVKSLGKSGEVKEVKDGYGKNFLIAKGFAKHATPEVLEAYHKEQEKKAADEATLIASLESLKTTLADKTTLITKPLGNNGHLFGAVTKEEIAEAVKAQHNLNIEKKHIEHKKPIKTVGLHDLDLKLGHGIHGILHIDVQGA